MVQRGYGDNGKKSVPLLSGDVARRGWDSGGVRLALGFDTYDEYEWSGLRASTPCCDCVLLPICCVSKGLSFPSISRIMKEAMCVLQMCQGETSSGAFQSNMGFVTGSGTGGVGEMVHGR